MNDPQKSQKKIVVIRLNEKSWKIAPDNLARKILSKHEADEVKK